MARLPTAPLSDELRTRLTARPVTLRAGSRLWRIYAQGGPHSAQWYDFRFFGPTGARFDHHVRDSRGNPCVQARGIYYAGGPDEGIMICLAEYFQSTGVINRKRRSPWLVAFELTRDVLLLDLCAVWPTAAGASMAINTGPHARARGWSVSIYEAYPHIEGLWYSSSMYANKPAVALYERARTAIPATPLFHRALADPALFGRLDRAAQIINYTLL